MAGFPGGIMIPLGFANKSAADKPARGSDDADTFSCLLTRLPTTSEAEPIDGTSATGLLERNSKRLNWGIERTRWRGSGE